MFHKRILIHKLNHWEIIPWGNSSEANFPRDIAWIYLVIKPFSNMEEFSVDVIYYYYQYCSETIIIRTNEKMWKKNTNFKRCNLNLTASKVVLHGRRNEDKESVWPECYCWRWGEEGGWSLIPMHWRPPLDSFSSVGCTLLVLLFPSSLQFAFLSC